MNLSYKKVVLAALLMVVLLQLSGCGETAHGIGKDVQRMGKGVKTIFIRDSE